MAEQDKRISEYTTTQAVSGNDLDILIVEDQNSASGYSSRKILSSDKAKGYLNTLSFPLLLNTNSKTIIGAINELQASSGGATVLTGTTAPTSSQGTDGSLYVQYTAGTGGASDVVDAMYVKLDGEWVEIQLGGGGGTATTLTGTLTAGQTTITFTDPAITTDSKVEVLTSDISVAPSGATFSTGTITLTFAAQTNDVVVRLEVR